MPAMCVIAFAYKMPGLGQLVLLANRDEYYARPAAPLDWWDGHTDTLGGRDLQAGGSWLMVDGRGRFAALTNFREGYGKSGERSRGELVQRFVTGDDDPFTFADWLRDNHQHYAPFNLLYGKVDDLFHFHSRGARIARVTPGMHTCPMPRWTPRGSRANGWPNTCAACAARQAKTKPLAGWPMPPLRAPASCPIPGWAGTGKPCRRSSSRAATTAPARRCCSTYRHGVM
jgi:hypothetical protein